jgi:hypothetical protein
MSVHHRRAGATLTEVLMAIFVMAIGMISLLVLFPVGIQRMAQSITNNRVAQAAANAEAQAEFRNIRGDAMVEGDAARYQTIYGFGPDDPSVPILVDPIGFEVFGTTPVGTLGANRGIPRSTLANFPAGMGRRWFSVEDDLNFEKTGGPVNNGLIERDRRVSWGYLWKRPRFSDPRVVDLTIVLFLGRKLGADANRSATPTGEVAMGGPAATGNRVFVAGNTQAVVTWGRGTAQPPVKRGDWVLDATVMRIPPTGPGRVLSNGYFYKVAGVGDPTQDPQTGAMLQELTLATPARADGYVIVFMPFVVDVIEKNDGRMPQ